MRLELRGISQAFPEVLANDRIDLDVAAGEIHAVLGENGAGKSTLMKIISGVLRPDAGDIRWEGKPVWIGSPARAQSLGIAMVHQHFALFETLTVAENIALALPGRLELRQLAARIESVASRYGLALDPTRHVHTMSVGERQRAEIVRCLLQSPRLLIMDEPTSVLTPQAALGLFETIRQLAADGCAILYISHKLEEVRALCTRASVLRQGRKVGEVDPREVGLRELAEMMIGRDLPRISHGGARPGDAALAVQGLSRPAADPFGVALADVDLVVAAGEVVGIAGVSGNGQQELLAALSGERAGRPTAEPAGAVRLLGVDANWLDAGARRDLGLAFVPEERLGTGAVPPMSLSANAALTGWRQGMVRRFGMLDRHAARSFAQRCIEGFDVRVPGPEVPASSLSGGNLQKYLVGREILLRPRVIMLGQPTWGVDVGAATMIRQRIRDLAAAGMAVLIVSDDLEELLQTCDRIAVMYRGRLSPPRDVGDTTPHEIGLWMAGLWPGGPGHSTRVHPARDGSAPRPGAATGVRASSPGAPQ